MGVSDDTGSSFDLNYINNDFNDFYLSVCVEMVPEHQIYPTLICMQVCSLLLYVCVY